MWWCPSWLKSGNESQNSPFFKVLEDLFNSRRVFQTSNDLDWAFALITDTYDNMAYRDVGQGREQELKLRTPFLVFASIMQEVQVPCSTGICENGKATATWRSVGVLSFHALSV
jgi:hypothetical protein